MIRLKRGVSIDSCRREILIGLISVDPIYAKHGVDTVITSGTEPYKHSALRSAHYRGDAVDLRIKNVEVDKRARVFLAIKRKLGLDFVVLHEGKGEVWEHIHMHWSPIFHG